MKYDVFISYSSHDQKVVEGLCAYLEERKIRCFVAYRDIPRGVVWARAITEALDESRMMVVVFSDHFNQSDQVDREIELASEDKKPILTFRITDDAFKGAKKYYLKNINWIDAFPNPEQVFGCLAENICRLLGMKMPTYISAPMQAKKIIPPPPKRNWRGARKWIAAVIALLLLVGIGIGVQNRIIENRAEQARLDSLAKVEARRAEADRIAKEKAEAERIAKEEAERKAEAERQAKAKAEAERFAKEKAEAERQETEYRLSGKGRNGIYRVGDYYNENGKKGVVLQVWDSGKHGKIVSLEQEDLQWCTNAQFKKGIVVGTSSNIDGKANTDKVMARADSAEYPAFVWCRNKGKDWYLPAIDELKLLLLNDSVHDAVNRTLENRGDTKLSNRGEWGNYWSSTEDDSNNRWVITVDMDLNNGMVCEGSKFFGLYDRCVRAVAQF